MQGWTEKISKLIQRVRKNRLVQWFQGQDVSIRYLIRFIIIALVIIAWNIINIYFNSFKINDTSAQYLLSALVQSLAAIIAIVVTMTLIAVQLAASAYSPRVIDIFKKNWVMWFLLFWYSSSIFYGLFVLEMIAGECPSLYPGVVPLESCVFLAYLMGIAAFAGLFLHIGNMIDLLNPENIIKKLALEITKDKILNPKKDPIQPIMDIIQVSIMKYDLATVECGLEAVMKKAAYIIDISKYSDDEHISMRFCGRFGTAGRCALHAGEDESAMSIIDCLKHIGTLAIKRRSDEFAKAAVQYIEMIGTVAAEKKLMFVACDTMESLKDVGILAAKNQRGDLTLQAIDSLGNVGMYAAENKIKIAAQGAARYLGRVGKYAAENELESATKQAADSLGVVGNYAADNKLEYATSEAVRSLRDVGEAAAKNKCKDATSQAVASLGVVGKTAAEKGLEDVVWQVRDSLELVEMAAKDNNLTIATRQKVESLKRFGETTARKGEVFEDVTIQMVGYIRGVGESATKDGDKDLIKRVVESLMYVGKTTVEQKLKDATWAVVHSIGLVGVAAAEKGEVCRDATKHVIESLHLHQIHITESTGGVEFFKTATEQTARSLIEIGMYAIENDLDDVVEGCANCFVEWTKSWEKLELPKLFREWWIKPEHRESACTFEKRCEKLRTRNYNKLRTH